MLITNHELFARQIDAQAAELNCAAWDTPNMQIWTPDMLVVMYANSVRPDMIIESQLRYWFGKLIIAAHHADMPLRKMS